MTCLAVPLKPLFEAMPTFGQMILGPASILLLLLLEVAYHSVIKTCCQNIGDYEAFHNSLRAPVETTYTILDALGRLCLKNPESAGDIGQAEGQASPPPPYTVCVLLLEPLLASHISSQMNSPLTSATDSESQLMVPSRCIVVSKSDNPYYTS